MKNLAFIFILTLVMAACGQQGGTKQTGGDAAKVEAIAPENLQKIEIAVVGMSCEGCERTVQTAVKSLPGVQDVKASHLDSTAVVTFDITKATFEQMQTAIVEKGYEATGFQVINPE